MKNLIPILFFSLILFACNELKPKVPQIILSGQIENSEDSIITLRQDDQTQEIYLNNDGSFSDTIYDFENGYFTMILGNEYTNLYLKDGYDLNIKLDASMFDESLKYNGIGANENNFLAQQMIRSINFRYWDLWKFEETSFLLKVDSLVNSKNELLSEHILLVPEFDKELFELEKINNQYFGAYVKEEYASAHKYYDKSDSFKVSENFYSYRKNVALENKYALKTDYYPMYVNSYIRNKMSKTDTSENSFKLLKTIDTEIKDNDLKKEFIYRSAKLNINYVNKLDEYWVLVSYMVTDKEQLKELKKKYTDRLKIQSGEKSPLTSFTDFEDKSFHLQDFKGKYIYIDIWAQWCGPCKKEAPFLKEIEAKYADKDIHFLKLSLDEDKEAWKNYIEEKGVTENSYLVPKAFDSEFAKAYIIKFIPRFILLDKDLNIIDSNAPRPSDEKLVSVLDKLL